MCPMCGNNSICVSDATVQKWTGRILICLAIFLRFKVYFLLRWFLNGRQQKKNSRHKSQLAAARQLLYTIKTLVESDQRILQNFHDTKPGF